MEQERRDIIDECNKNIRETIHETNREIMAARSLTEAAIEETRYANAKLNALKKLHGMFTDEDDFRAIDFEYDEYLNEDMEDNNGDFSAVLSIDSVAEFLNQK